MYTTCTENPDAICNYVFYSLNEKKMQLALGFFDLTSIKKLYTCNGDKQKVCVDD